MISGAALRQSASGWELASEAALEKFIWENLQELLDIKPLKQQYISQGEISDILAINNDGGLVILELKNTEDRYLVQQLTRYYANLMEEKPFAEKVDYTRPVRLIAIAPTYHRHNLVDKEHSTLNFEFLQFSVTRESEGFQFVLQNLELGTVQKYRIPYKAIDIPVVENIPEPPDLLLKWLGSCSSQEQTGFLRMRTKILSCSPKMKEIVDKKTIQYGSGKTRLCAEFCFQQKTQTPVLFLWLPTELSYRRYRVRKADAPNEIAFSQKPIIGRHRIWTNGEAISHVGHIPEGFGKKKLQSEWDQIPPSKRPKTLTEGVSGKSLIPGRINRYLRIFKDDETPDYWEFLSDLAIESWLAKT